MSLKDYVVERCKFEPQETVSMFAFAFPCSACKHRNKDQHDAPCITCDHNLASKKEGQSGE